MKDEMGQEVLGFAGGERFPPAKLSGFGDLGYPPAKTLKAVRTQNWHCGCCGASLLPVSWLHYDAALKKGHQDYHCLNPKCEQVEKILRIPMVVEHFPEV